MGTYVFSFGTSMLLARLLTPNDFGEVALATTIADFLFLLVGLSLPNALLREPESTVQIAVRTSMTMMAVASLALAILGAAIGIGLGSWISETVGLIFAAVVVGRMAPLFGLCLTSDLQRRNRYGQYSTVVYGSQVVSLVVAIVLGLLGAGVWALVAREVSSGVCLLVLSMWFSHWKIRFGFDRAKCIELVKFGLLLLGSRVGDLAFHRYDNLIVGSLAGTRQLGLYNQAYVVAELSNKVYAPVIYQVPLGVYSQIQGDTARTGLMYRLMMYAIVRSVLPIALLMVTFPSELLDLVFGAQWTPASEMLRALGVYTLLLPVFEHARVLLVANGAVGATLRARGVQLAVFIPATPPLTLALGARGAGIAVACAMILGTVSIVRHAQRFAAFRFVDCVAPLGAGAAAVLGGWATGELLPDGPLSFAIGVVVLLMVYTLTLLAVERERLLTNVRLIWSYIQQQQPPVLPEQPGMST